MKRILITMLALLPVTAWAEATPADKLQEALADMVNKSVQVAGDAKDFLVVQLLDVVKQLLAWKMAESIGYCLLSFLIAGALIKYIRWYMRFGKEKEWDFDQYEELIPATVCGGIGGLIGTVTVVLNFNLVWLQIWLAPKVYLIEYAGRVLHK